MKNNNLLWGGAFKVSPSDAVIQFGAGRDVKALPAADEVLIPYDVKTNKAHAKMLWKQNILTESEFNSLDKTLNEVLELYKKGEFILDPNLEDVHTNIEAYLINKLGIDVGGKIHTARSRNDQVVSDMFLYLHDQVSYFINSTKELIGEIDQQAIKYHETICPGFTHHQHATVTTFGEILISFSSALKRDVQKLEAIHSIFNYSPLGAVTSYGTTFNIDPKVSASELGFSKPFENSIDVITNRGEFETNLAFCISNLMNHCSTIAQTLILFSTSEFGFIKLADEYTTGSSIMPQKKNPDVLEIIKAKAGYTIGMLTGMLSIQNSTFIGYNRESMQTKYMIMDVIEETKLVPVILAGIIKNLEVNDSKMAEQCNKGFITATGLMEQIIQNKNIPMRVAKKLIELAIRKSIEMGNMNTVNFDALTESVQELNLNVIITQKELNKWQDPNHQIKLIIK